MAPDHFICRLGDFRVINRGLERAKIPCGNFDGTQGSREGEIASVRRTGPNVLPFENGCKYAVKVEKRALDETGALFEMAEPTGLEPATSDVTGRRSNQLNYGSVKSSPRERCVSWRASPTRRALVNGRHGGTRTRNPRLVRAVVYH